MLAVTNSYFSKENTCLVNCFLDNIRNHHQNKIPYIPVKMAFIGKNTSFLDEVVSYLKKEVPNIKIMECIKNTGENGKLLLIDDYFFILNDTVTSTSFEFIDIPFKVDL